MTAHVLATQHVRESAEGKQTSLRILLICGIVSSLYYVVLNIIVAMQWDAYRVASQTVSELSAIGAPTRPLWVVLCLGYTLLLAGFGWGVRAFSADNRLLRTAGALIVANAIIGLEWPPMHLREVLAAGGASLTDTLHIVWTAVTVLLTIAAIGLAATALGKRFRLYSIATVMVMLTFGTLTGMDAPRMQANLPTPWIGVWERIAIAAQILWIAALGTSLLRLRNRAGGTGVAREIAAG